MTPTPPEVIPNGRYSTLEAAALLVSNAERCGE